jgi:hypothetical protein
VFSALYLRKVVGSVLLRFVIATQRGEILKPQGKMAQEKQLELGSRFISSKK